jgi:DNA processing protein
VSARPAPSACLECLRRGWLLGALTKQLRYRGRDPERLLDLLELGDGELVRAVGGDEGDSLRERHARFDPADMPTPPGVERICRHDPGYPPALAGAAGRGARVGGTREGRAREGRAREGGARVGGARVGGTPNMLHVAGGIARLRELLAEPAVAIVGTRAASDYGMEVAHGLARGLAAAGVTVVSGLAEGIPAAAHAGALEANGPTLTVMPGGVDVCYPATRRALFRRLRESACIISELPCGCHGGGWAHTARTRIVTALADMVILVEAGERPVELLGAHLAWATGRAVAAVPGRVTAPAARGPHTLLMRGAQLVRDPQDALDALYGMGVRRAPSRRPGLEPRLRAVLEQVGSGRDTLAKLTARGSPHQDTIVALAELELLGAVTRGDGGRYVPCL